MTTKVLTPHWERGYRTHGYWLGIRRVGWVGLPPRNPRTVPLIYGCGVVTPKGVPVEWKDTNLRRAKRTVTRLYQELHAKGDK